MSLMIYISYIIYSDYMVTCVLAVRDDELTVGDNDNVSSLVAEGIGMCGSAQGTHMVGQPGNLASGLQFTRDCGNKENDIITISCLYLNSTH